MDPIAVKKGARQGCLLSPLLFILSLEVLLNQIRNHPSITGVKTKIVQVKLKAFAGDLLIIPEDFKNAISSLCVMLFGAPIQHGKTVKISCTMNAKGSVGEGSYKII